MIRVTANMRGAGQLGVVQLLRDLFPKSERRRLALVTIAALGAALFETVGVASIVPFMAAVVDPSAVAPSTIFGATAAVLGAGSEQERLMVLGGLTLCLVFLGSAAAAGAVWSQQWFIMRTRRRLAASLFDGYLARPYTFHVRRDAPSLMKVLVHDMDQAVSVIGAALVLCSRGAMTVGLLLLLLSRSPVVAATLALALGGTYGLIYRAMRQRQDRLGLSLTGAASDQMRAGQEAFGGIKDLLVLGRTAEASRRFDDATNTIATTLAKHSLTSSMPRYIVEPLVFGGLVAATLALLVAGGGPVEAVPTLALYAFVAYRLLPALQMIFGASVSLRFGLPSLRSVHADLIGRTSPSTGCDSEQRADFTQAISLSHVTFRHPGANRAALADVSLEVRRGESIGLVGRTGAGKSTLADLLLGLYEPDSGEITVDGRRINRSTVRSWRKQVGYVPQHVFLSNASIAQNIAFGLGTEEIDAVAVRRAADLAQASEFIQGLPEGFSTEVGERGVRLSGGQRQRLGIARALYHRPSVLIFDEATSALDGLTEDAVMEAIRHLTGDHTVVLVAHRLRTVEVCDRIVMLEQGQVVADGSYASLLRNSNTFRKFVGHRTDADSAE